MTHLFLRSLNAPILVLLVTFGLAVQSSLFSTYPFIYLQPDIVLLAVIWCALKRGFTEGGIITLVVSTIAESHSGAPSGLIMSSMMLVFLTIRAMGRYFVFNNLSSLVGLTLFASIYWKLSTLVILWSLNESANVWRYVLALVLPWSVMEGVVGTWVFKWFEKFDWVTYKDPRARRAAEDAFQLDEEGL